MTPKSVFDLIGVVSPICLLKCKSELDRMDSGDELEIMVQDPEVVKDLLRIIHRSQCCLIASHNEEDHYRLHIQKN